MDGRIFLLAGHAGAGKNTIIKELMCMDNVVYVPSVTTRSIRSYEVHGKNYHFVTEEEFNVMIKRNEFIEYENVHGNLYGTLKLDYEKELNRGHYIVKDIDVNGALKFKELFGDIATTIYVHVEEEKELRRRLISRGESTEEIDNRMKRIKYELMNKELFDYVVVNNMLTEAVADCLNIIEKES